LQGQDTLILITDSFTPLFLLRVVKHVQAQTLGIKHQSVLATRFLHLRSNEAGILNLLQLEVGLVLLDGLTNQLSGASLTLGPDDHRLLLLASFVDDKGSALGILLGNLLGFDGSGEFGGESQVLIRGIYGLAV
jgi:hypothetical protein